MRGAGSGRLGVVLALALSAGCAGAPALPEVDALLRPEWRVGDRWLFRRTPLAGVPALVTHRVVQATADGYTVETEGLAPAARRGWSRELALARHAVGDRVSVHDPPIRYFDWPLRLGQAWTHEFVARDGAVEGRHRHTFRVAQTVEPVDVPAGPFYAVRIEHWGSRGERVDTYWYVPQVRYWVKLEHYGGGYTEELVEFTRVRP